MTMIDHRVYNTSLPDPVFCKLSVKNGNSYNIMIQALFNSLFNIRCDSVQRLKKKNRKKEKI